MARWFWLLIIFFLISCTTTPVKKEEEFFSSESAQKVQVEEKKPSEIDFIKRLQVVKLDHKYFQILYSKKHRLPVWVEYVATKQDLKGSGRRKNNFYKDKILEQMGIKPVASEDYARTGYDRGHMAPAADFKKSQAAIDATFVMSNMAPQTANLNRSAWEKLEARVRKWICGEEKLTIITGPILRSDLPKLEKGISIPEKFFKVIYDETPPLKSIAFIYLQTDSGDPYLKKVTSLTTIEKEAGIRLPKSIKNYPEVKNISSWKSCK